MTLVDLRNRLMDAYGRDRLTPVTVLACYAIADLLYDLVKPSAIETNLTTTSPMYNEMTLLDCIAAGDLDTPLGALSALAEGIFT